MTEREQLEQAIAALEAQRAILGDAVVDASVAALREKLAALEPPPSPSNNANKWQFSSPTSASLTSVNR